jgi:hypothetical protein
MIGASEGFTIQVPVAGGGAGLAAVIAVAALARRRRLRSAFAAALLSLLAVTPARAGIVGFPCEPGHSSPNGFEPCSACAPGTFAAASGSVGCASCASGTYASGSGSTICEAPVVFEFTGSVGEILAPQGGSPPFHLGDPIEGSVSLDRTRLLTDRDVCTDYQGAVVAFEGSIGAGAGRIEATGTTGRVSVCGVIPPSDEVWIEAAIFVGGAVEANTFDLRATERRDAARRGCAADRSRRADGFRRPADPLGLRR